MPVPCTLKTALVGMIIVVLRVKNARYDTRQSETVKLRRSSLYYHHNRVLSGPPYKYELIVVALLRRRTI